jgi:hypothetical protein
MEAAIVDVFVLGAASGAHWKLVHRGAAAVVGDVAHDCEARPTVHAINEGIETPAIGGGEQFTQAVVANRDIGRDQRANPVARLTGENLERMVAVERKLTDGNRADAGKSGRFLRQAHHEVVHMLDRSLDFDCDAGGGIPDRSGQIEFGGKPKDMLPPGTKLFCRPFTAVSVSLG